MSKLLVIEKCRECPYVDETRNPFLKGICKHFDVFPLDVTKNLFLENISNECPLDDYK